MPAPETQSNGGDVKPATQQKQQEATRNGDTGNSSVKERATSVYAYAQRSLNRVLSPDTRERAFTTTSELAYARPLFFSFAALQLLLSLLPVALFLTFAFSVVAFAFCAALIFILFWIGVAFFLLIPVLFFASSVALLCWLWTVGSFVAARWLYSYVLAGVFPGSGYNKDKSVDVTVKNPSQKENGIEEK